MSRPHTGRSRGAQPANTNSLKHGLYSQHISQHNTAQDDRQLDAMPVDKNENELALARVRLKDLIMKQDAAAEEHWFNYERAIEHYLDKIIAITHKNAILGRDGSNAFVTVMAMIRQTNEDQHVE